jgi:hypothetical protein
MVRTDANGEEFWSQTYGDSIIGQWAYCVKEDYDGGFVIAGLKHLTTTLRNAWIIKTDSNGDTVWTTMFGGETNADAYHVSCTPDSGYIVTGRRYDYGEFSNAYLLKLDSEGEVDWVQVFHESGYEEGYTVQQTSDGGYMLAGSKDITGRGWDFYLIKTDEDGTLEWSETYGGTNYDHCTSAQQTSDGGYIMFGESDSNIPNSSMALKTNTDGDSIWCYNYSRSNGDYGFSVDQCDGGGYIFGGYTNNPGYNDDYWFMRTDENGDTLWMQTIMRGNNQRGYCVLQTSDGGYVLAGESLEPNPTYYDFYVVKLNATPTAIDGNPVLPSTLKLSQNYPNPFNAQTTIKYELPKPAYVTISIYDLLGREIDVLLKEYKQAGYYQAVWNADGIPSGMYFYKIQIGDNSGKKKMLLLK